MLRLWYPLHAIRLDRYPVTWLDSRASRLVMNVVDIYSVHKLLRHETLQVTKRYATSRTPIYSAPPSLLAGDTGSVTA